MPLDSGEVQFDWNSVTHFVQSGQFEQAAELLQRAQTASDGIGNPLIVAALAAARQICLACLQSQTDLEWYAQAGNETAQRRDLLRTYAQSILDRIGGQDFSELSGPVQMPAVALKTPLKPRRPASIKIFFRGLADRWQNLFKATEEEAAPPSTLPSVALIRPSQEQQRAESLEPESSRSSEIVPEPVETTALPMQPAMAHTTVTYRLVVYALGKFRVYQNDQLIEEWNGLKGQSVLKYLIANRGVPVAKEVLMDIFWTDAEPEAARRNLHQAIYSLRQTLRRHDPNTNHISFENNQYTLNPELSIWVDIEEFESLIRHARRLNTPDQVAELMMQYSAAEGLYQGDFLAEDMYEDWPRAQRERLRALYLETANNLGEHYIQQSEYSAAIAICQKILSFDNCYEEAHRRLMRSYIAQGHRHLAVRQYQTCVQALAEELDVPPSEETIALYEQIANHF